MSTSHRSGPERPSYTDTLRLKAAIQGKTMQMRTYVRHRTSRYSGDIGAAILGFAIAACATGLIFCGYMFVFMH